MNKPKAGTTTLATATVEFYTAEFNHIHQMCDVADVPRWYDGMAYTAAQRVEILQSAYARLAIQAIGGTLAPFTEPSPQGNHP